jgi:predicted XRE-type DNA-binding protein
MRKDNRFVDTADTLRKLPQFVTAVMAINDHSQAAVAEAYNLTQAQVSRFLNNKTQGLEVCLKMLDYCQKNDPTGRSYRIVQVMNQ